MPGFALAVESQRGAEIQCLLPPLPCLKLAARERSLARKACDLEKLRNSSGPMDGTLRLVFQVSLRLGHAAKPRGPVSFPSYKLTCERLEGPFGPRKISTG